MKPTHGFGIRPLGAASCGRMLAAAGAAVVSIWMGIISCAQVPPVIPAPPPVEKALIGKTKQDVLACADGAPHERTEGNITNLVFYREASQLEESFAGSKSSVSQVHHGCLAHVLLQEGRVREIHYHAVPPTYPGYDHCDAIFEACLGR